MASLEFAWSDLGVFKKKESQEEQYEDAKAKKKRSTSTMESYRASAPETGVYDRVPL
jgi:hypothetical protein